MTKRNIQVKQLWGRKRRVRSQQEWTTHERPLCPECGHETDQVEISKKELAAWRGLWKADGEYEAFHPCQAEWFVKKPKIYESRWGIWVPEQLPIVCGRDGCTNVVGKESV